MIDLQCGDVLLYDQWYAVSDWLVKMKTGSAIVHCEVVASDGLPPSVASARFRGVDDYLFEPKALRFVLRPLQPFDRHAANIWFETVQGQPYGYLGLFGYYNADLQTDTGDWTCSKLATRYLRAGGVDAFNGYVSGGIAPGDFLKSSALRKHEV